MQAADDAFAEYVINWDQEQHQREGGKRGGKTNDNYKNTRNVTVVVINEGEEEHREKEEREGNTGSKEGDDDGDHSTSVGEYVDWIIERSYN